MSELANVGNYGRMGNQAMTSREQLKARLQVGGGE